HPTIAGVLLAFCIPLSRISSLEHALYHVVNFVIMPLFALANTAIIFPSVFGHIIHSPITFGIILGLVLGKPLGIYIFSFLSVKFKIASLPSNTHWKQILGAGMIAGIGFTMSIFIATLAYKEEELQVISKIAIIVGSVLSGLLGYFFLRAFSRRPEK
ncbi:MAG: Na+/H+ antiporter NhaA, partial [Chitinophagaceae bacterium]